MFKESVDLNKINKVFFIGIGGIGISAAARILNQQEKIVMGSDAAASEITQQLEQEGIKVIVPQSVDNIKPGIDLVVYTVAVTEDNPERQRAKELNTPQITYPQLLGILMRNKYAIGVSGTNGKTTTSAMLGLIFMEAGLDPTIVIGGKTDCFGGNSRLGQGDYFIFESDEYRRAFANYNPKMAVVTYIEADHLDYYKDLNDIKSAFSDYLKRVPADGFIFINSDDQESAEVIKKCPAKIITFGLDRPADIGAKNIRVENRRQFFNVYYQGKNLGEIVLSVPAKYNIYNALAAMGPALTLGVDFKIIQKTLKEFQGTWRRFEKLGKLGATEFIADYAHTPDAVEKTIAALKEFYPGKKMLVIFQPHQYNRTKNFFKEFAASFKGADQVIILDIFFVKGRENPADFDVSAEKLAVAIKKNGVDARYGDEMTLNELSGLVNFSDFDLVLIMGAGDIYSNVKEMLKEVIDEEVEKELATEEELAEKYKFKEASKRPKMKGVGFSKQKQVIEENAFYTKRKKR
ncbi:UDP-N-acetylmuramate--L-alanine ligase [Candidatus Falkowbacteria bacterium]|nr:UDP-N-acetylmuramate--L-alanine ligase [Candidatus Falkowbacteria bacterium]